MIEYEEVPLPKVQQDAVNAGLTDAIRNCPVGFSFIWEIKDGTTLQAVRASIHHFSKKLDMRITTRLLKGNDPVALRIWRIE